MTAIRLLTTFRFRVTLRVAGHGDIVLADGAFAECSGLDVEMDVSEYLEGGNNAVVLQRAGRAKYPRLSLKRGMLYPARADELDRRLWDWIQGIVAGERPIQRVDGEVVILGDGDHPLAVWRFRRALPAKLVGPQLNAKTGEVAIEALELAHEGLVLDDPQGGAR